MSNILSSLTQLNVGAVATDLIISQPVGKTAALKAIAMNAQSCSILPVLLPDPLDLNLWTATFSILEPSVTGKETQTISLILPNFNQPNLLVEVASIILQPIPGYPGFGKFPPSINIAPLCNVAYWAESTKDALESSSPLYSNYKFTPSDYDGVTGFYGIPKLAIITVAFKGSTAN
jgi:hypothetical protein